MSKGKKAEEWDSEALLQAVQKISTGWLRIQSLPRNDQRVNLSIGL